MKEIAVWLEYYRKLCEDRFKALDKLLNRMKTDKKKTKKIINNQKTKK